MHHLHRPISIREIKSIINNLLEKQKESGPDGFTNESCQTFREGITPILYNLFQKIEAVGLLPSY